MTAFLRQKVVLDVAETDEHIIRVALAGADQDALMKEFGKETVDKANRDWSHVSRLIIYPPILSQIWAAGSPGEGCKIFKKHYALRPMWKVQTEPILVQRGNEGWGTSQRIFCKGKRNQEQP